MKRTSIVLILVMVIVVNLSSCNFFNDKYEVTKEEYEFLKSFTEEEYEFLKNIDREQYILFENFDLLMTAIEYCENHYYEDIDYSRADIQAAIAMVGSLDRYSSLQLASQMASQSTAGIGLGLDVTIYNEYRINFVHPNTPAAAPSIGPKQYYLERGDHIYSIKRGDDIDFTRVEGAAFNYFSAVSAGGAGTTLTLTIKRGDIILDEVFVATKKKDELKEAYYINNIAGLPESVGYIKLLSFTGKAKEHFEDCITQFQTDNNEQLILDLRGNGGGSSGIMSEIGNYLITNSTNSNSIPIIELENKNGDIQEFKTDNNLFINVPIVVLINGRTASAAEALASAMVYYGNAITVGEKTYGKGTALNMPAALGNTGFNISIVVGKYYVYTDDLETYPTGKWCIEGIGLTPNIEVANRDFKLLLSEDPDIIEAINYFFPQAN